MKGIPFNAVNMKLLSTTNNFLDKKYLKSFSLGQTHGEKLSILFYLLHTRADALFESRAPDAVCTKVLNMGSQLVSGD